MRREVAAEERAGDARQAEHGAEDPLIAASLARRHDVADDRLGRDGEPAPAESLNGAEDDELGHVPAQSTERGAGEKEEDCALQDAFASVQIAELSVEWRDDGLREEVRGDDPRESRESAELADDGRQRRRDDRRIERGEEHAEHEPTEDDENLPVTERRRRRGHGSGHGLVLEVCGKPPRISRRACAGARRPLSRGCPDAERG